MMGEPPSGTVTFLFTDIEGSTRLWDEHPEEMRAALARHDVLLRHAIEAQGGHVFHTSGDAFCVVFARATDAVVAALDAQRALQTESWAVGPLRVRMALHTGEAEERDGDYYGPPLNRCARILSAGHGGQVLLSRTTAELVEDALPDRGELKSLGEHRLRDLSLPETLFQLAHPDTAAVFPRLRSLQALGHNLPVQLTSFIGREAELVEVRRLLGATRLLTLVGAGGAGKTRLALQAAGELVDDYPDGAWLVSLASLVDPGLMPQAILSALGLREEPQRELKDTLFESLAPKHALLILDNCEHLIDASAHLAEDLLRACPDLRLLATSREPLQCEGEVLWRVPSLSAPPGGGDHTRPPAELAGYEAVRLFLDRAGAADPRFALTTDNAAAVAEICWRLDGIPLALELAAARVRTMAVGEIAARLDDRFALLTSGRRTALPRHQTLEAAVDWSYHLLLESERAFLRRLSVFAGGWDLESAAFVCGTEGAQAATIADALSALADKSLVAVEPGEEGARYHLLETLREYAARRLGEAGESEAYTRRHAERYLGLAEESRGGLKGPGESRWLSRLEVDHDNLRLAFGWAVDRDAMAAADVACALWWFWRIRGFWAEGREWFAQVIGKGDALPREMRARLLGNAGDLALCQGRYAEAEAAMEAGLALYRDCGDQAGVANTLNRLGVVAGRRGDHPAAQAIFEQALQAGQTAADPDTVASIYHNLGQVAANQGDYRAGRAYLERALALQRELGNRSAVANGLSSLAVAAHEQGDYEAATRLYAESLAMTRELGFHYLTAQTLHNLGSLFQETGDLEAARRHLEQAIALREELGEADGLASSQSSLGAVLSALGDHEAARRLCEASVARLEELGAMRDLAYALAGLAEVLRAEGQPLPARGHFCRCLRVAAQISFPRPAEGALTGLAGIAEAAGEPGRAACLLGAAEALRKATGTTMAPGEAEEDPLRLARLRAALGDECFQAAWDAGQAMSLDEAVTYALGEGSDA